MPKGKGKRPTPEQIVEILRRSGSGEGPGLMGSRRVLLVALRIENRTHHGQPVLPEGHFHWPNANRGPTNKTRA